MGSEMCIRDSGMVPRESDYEDTAPSATVTTPEPQPIRTAEFDIPAREAENRGERAMNAIEAARAGKT